MEQNDNTESDPNNKKRGGTIPPLVPAGQSFPKRRKSIGTSDGRAMSPPRWSPRPTHRDIPRDSRLPPVFSLEGIDSQASTTSPTSPTSLSSSTSLTSPTPLTSSNPLISPTVATLPTFPNFPVSPATGAVSSIRDESPQIAARTDVRRTILLRIDESIEISHRRKLPGVATISAALGTQPSADAPSESSPESDASVTVIPAIRRAEPLPDKPIE